MTKHIGIVAVSAEGAALCYRTICTEGAERLGRHAHPIVTMHTLPLNQYMEPIYAGRWDVVANLLLSSAAALVDAGADFLICPDNTVHEAWSWIGDRAPRKWLHIAEAVAAEAAARRYKKLGVLGTRFLMEGPVYPEQLAERGIKHLTPEPEDRERVNAIIFDELVYGQLTDDSRAAFGEVIGRLKSRGCDAVVLGCTEIPLLIGQEDSPLPILDSTRLLARAALRYASGEQAF
jgi:aspartate racemase